MTEKMDMDQEDSVIQNIPIPPDPQIIKSSNEILCELFGAFNATPPPLDDTLLNYNPDPSNSLAKYKKKHKKHKKKHKKIKKKRLSSESSHESKKEARKKTKKDKIKSSETKPVSSNKKKKRKLGKFSASDSDSDKEEPRIKRNKCNDDKLIISLRKCDKVTIKNEKDNDSVNLGFSVIPDSIKENILKHAVCKIVDKVIDSTNLATGICNNIACMQVSNSNLSDEVFGNKCEIVKKEPNKSVQFPNRGVNKEPNSSTESNLQTGEVPIKPVPIADVFAEDLLDCGIDKETALVPEKTKSAGGKITIKNLKFSQLYEATVKQIEEEAKLKAEKYEEGELSDSSSEEKGRSPTPSESSVSESLKGLSEAKSLEGKERLCKHYHKRVKTHHRQSSDKKRSVSKERCKSNSCRKQSRSHHHKQTHRTETREKKRSRSRERSKVLARDQSESTTKDTSRKRSRDKSREKCQSKERKRSKDRVRMRSKDRTTDKNQEAREKTKSKRSHSGERDKRNSDEKIDKHKLLEIARKNALNRMKIPSGTLDQTKVAITAGGKTVNELTDFCKLLSQKDADGHDSISSNTSNSSDSESEKPFHHPFQLKDRPSNIVLNIRNSVALPVKSLQEKTAESSRQLRLQFPVSSGQHHRKTESEWIPVSPKKTESIFTSTNMQVAVVKPITTHRHHVFKDTPEPPSMDIGSIVSQRLTAIRRLQENPTDTEALTQMYKAQKNMRNWAESKQDAPGQFTGSTGVKVLSPAELASGHQAWARRDQLQSAAPVNSGMGMALLQKMGWKPGEGLGKNKEGTLQPLLLEVKMDKKGLVAQEELPIRLPQQVSRGPAPKSRSLEGKHPISVLNEYCSRRKYMPACFELVDEVGPDHKKNFLFKVRVNGVEYKPAVASPKKKQARAEAAEVCLKTLGILPNK